MYNETNMPIMGKTMTTKMPPKIKANFIFFSLESVSFLEIFFSPFHFLKIILFIITTSVVKFFILLK